MQLSSIISFILCLEFGWLDCLDEEKAWNVFQDLEISKEASLSIYTKWLAWRFAHRKVSFKDEHDSSNW